MTTLSLADMKTVVSAAFQRWLDQSPNDFTVTTGAGDVQVTARLYGQSFDCGVPGYQLANGDIAALAVWVPTVVKKNGNQGSLAPCRDIGRGPQVNVWLKGGVYVMFNFHINLTSPC